MSPPSLPHLQLTWLNSVDVRRWRVLTAARVFTLAAALGLASSTGYIPTASGSFLALCLLALVMSIPLPTGPLMKWAPVAEAALAALVLSSAGEVTTPLLAYLVVPPLAAGLRTGARSAILTVLVELGAVAAMLVGSRQLTDIAEVAERTGPWLLAGLGAGLLGSWMRTGTPLETTEQARYESAHRLLAQLRAVSRRLSAGLDTESIAQHTLQHCTDLVGGHRSVLLTSTEGGTLTPLSTLGAVPFTETPERDAVVADCWASESPRQCAVPTGSALTRYRTVVPLRVGVRMIGVIVADGPASVDPETLDGLRGFLAEQSLRLETALLFEQVRSMATMEERHRLAREIHDGVAQEIASLGYLVDHLAHDEHSADARETALQLRGELSRIVGELRLSIFDLRTGVSPRGGLGLALSDYVREVGTRSGMTVHLALAENPRRLRVDVETELLRIAQEAITNARKHAQAANLWVLLDTESPLIVLRVEDDGVGDVSLRDDHYGLRIMRERADRIGADLTIDTRTGRGTAVAVTIDRTASHLTGDHHGHASLDHR